MFPSLLPTEHRGAGTGPAGQEPLTRITNYTEASQARICDTKQNKSQFQLAVVTCISYQTLHFAVTYMVNC